MIENLQDISIQKKYSEASSIGGFLIRGFFKSLTEIMPDSKIRSVLDAGCGEGINLILAHQQYPDADLVGFDIDEERIAKAQSTLDKKASISKGNIYEIDHPDNSFDLVLCNEVLEHLEEPQRAIAELYRVTNTYLIVSVPREPLWRCLNMIRFKYWSEWGNTPNHLNNWSASSFKHLFRDKFQLVTSAYPIPWQFHLFKKV